MITIKTIEDIRLLNENTELECKLANGANGKGGLPKKTFWETYSAFANTNGGVILLGVKENKGKFSIEGIKDIQKVLDDFWNTINNKQKISKNIVIEENIKIINISSKNIIQIYVPRAKRKERPIYLNNSPLVNSYIRLHSSDVKASEDLIKRMLSDQVRDTQDDELLENFGLNDINIDTLQRYRNMYVTINPSNERNTYNNVEFLRSIGAWRRNRKTNEEGLTVAGLLMFGHFISIQEIFPSYILDYQERPIVKGELRWMDRVTIDSNWSGNLFDFYLKVSKKLTFDLKIPFKLNGNTRIDDTPIHKSLREALVNTLVHADYSGKASILIIKKRGMFKFRNPGLMRIAIELAIQGYEHDARNEKIHQMFHFIGLGERAGSGIPNIFKWWNKEYGLKPILYEKLIPYEQTVLELRTMSLGDKDNNLGDKNNNLGDKDNSLGDKNNNLNNYIIDGLEFPIFDSIYKINKKLKEELIKIAIPVSSKKRITNKEILKKTIRDLCEDKYLTIELLAQLLNKSEVYLRKDVLNSMVENKELFRAFPKTPNDPRQAYTSRKNNE